MKLNHKSFIIDIKIKKRVMASSKTVLMDKISLCPKDFSNIKI
jgi:hypothetical protein